MKLEERRDQAVKWTLAVTHILPKLRGSIFQPAILDFPKHRRKPSPGKDHKPARWDRLSLLNEALIAFLRNALEITTPLVRSSELKASGAKSEMIIGLCRQVGADAYLAGTGGSKDYLDLDAFARAGIRVLWQDFQHPRYAQLPMRDSFIERLSAIDMLANCGPESARMLEGIKSGATAHA